MCQVQGQFRLRKELGTGGFGHAQLVMRQGKPFVLKMVGCDSINEANAALKQAACARDAAQAKLEASIHVALRVHAEEGREQHENEPRTDKPQQLTWCVEGVD